MRSFDFVMQHLEWYCYCCEIADCEGVFVVVLAVGPGLEIGHRKVRDFLASSDPYEKCLFQAHVGKVVFHYFRYVAVDYFYFLHVIFPDFCCFSVAVWY